MTGALLRAVPARARGTLAAELARSAANPLRRPMAASGSRDRSSSPTAPTSNRGLRAGSSGRSRTGAIATRTSSTVSRTASTGRGISQSSARCASMSRRRASPLQSIEFATLKIKDAICDRFRADVRKAPVRRQAAPGRPRITVSDRAATRRSTSTRPAKRSSSAAGAAMPMPRRCARTSPRASWRSPGWTPGTPLLDPMCGAGTIAIEAALVAADIAPGLQRTFGFQKLAWYDGPTWQRIRQRAHDRVRQAPSRRRSSRATSTRARSRNAAPTPRPRAWPDGSTSARPMCLRARRRRRPDSCRQSAVRRSPRRRRIARRVLSEARRRAQAALRRLDGVPASPAIRGCRS